MNKRPVTSAQPPEVLGNQGLVYSFAVICHQDIFERLKIGTPIALYGVENFISKRGGRERAISMAFILRILALMRLSFLLFFITNLAFAAEPIGITPVQQAQYLMSEEDLSWLLNARRYLLKITYPDYSGSAVLIGRTEKGHGVLLMSGHVVPIRGSLDGKDKVQLKSIEIDPDKPDSVLSALVTFATPSWQSPETWGGRVSFPFLHPDFPVNNGKRVIPYGDDFSFVLMGHKATGGVTVKKALEPLDPNEFPDIPDLDFGLPRDNEEVLLLGYPLYLGQPERILKGQESVYTIRESFATSRVLSLEESLQWAEEMGITFDPLKEVYLAGGADKGFSGGGVFNRQGQLIAITTAVYKPMNDTFKWSFDRMNRAQNPVDLVIATRVDHILQFADENSTGESARALKGVLDRSRKLLECKKILPI